MIIIYIGVSNRNVRHVCSEGGYSHMQISKNLRTSIQAVVEGFSVHGVPRPFKQWTRATVHLDDEGQLPALVGHSAVFTTYDLVAVRITAESSGTANKIFAKCCTALDIDIIS